MNVDRIREVGRLILAEPRRFDMRDWISENAEAPCGTACCFAGEWAVLEFGMDLVKRGLTTVYNQLAREGRRDTISGACRRALGLPNNFIFYMSTWPFRFRNFAVDLSPGTEEYARYFVDVVLEDYITTGGWVNREAS